MLDSQQLYELLITVRGLSLKDKKNLSQKFTKAVGEMGELSDAILAFENTDGSRHKFIKKDAILDEVADVMLCVMSIAYDLGYIHEDIIGMLEKKNDKWSANQRFDSKAEYPFEIHVTVQTSYAADLERFKEVCNMLKVKATVLELQDQHGKPQGVEVMTSSVHKGTNSSVLEELEREVHELQQAGFTILRQKLETMPQHPAAPSILNGRLMPKDCYFESHLEVVPGEVMNYRILEWVLNKYQAQYSKNAKKDRVIITYRESDFPYEPFMNQLEELKVDLQTVGFDIIEEQTEFSIYDTNVLHDEAWIKQ
jgi:NTP pyrophosphatase (non-canonical NTP hydrolase)